MTDILHEDYETRSRKDLLKCGAYEYAMHWSTLVLWFAWAFNDEEPVRWYQGEEFPARVLKHWAKGARRSIHAHNAAFERLITRHTLINQIPPFKQPPLAAYYCTSAQARARALPGGLDNLGRCLKLPIVKDQEGKNLIRKLSIPWSGNKIDWEGGTFNNDPVLMNKFGNYCIQDVVVERLAETKSPPLTEQEFTDYLINEEINDRGVFIDREFATAALDYADAELEDIHAELFRLTNGKITTARQFQRIKDWCQTYLDSNDALRKMVTRHKTDRRTGKTEIKISFDKANRYRLLNAEEEWPKPFVKLIELLDMAGSTSVSKYGAMLSRSERDGYLRGAFIYSGAGQTKRFSSTGAQLHNMRRDVPEDYMTTRKAIMKGDEIDDVMDTLASQLRPTLKMKKGRFTAGDLKQIEARVLPWLAGDTPGATNKLNLFRDGIDVYAVTAARIWRGRGAEKRQMGKVCELSLGYQGGYRALLAMARTYQEDIPEAEAKRLVSLWRELNPWVTTFWKQTNSAAIKAVRQPLTETHAGRLSYIYDPDWDMLFCILPNDSVISYPRPRLKFSEKFQSTSLTAIKANWLPGEGETEWPRVGLYGGLFAENGTQACAGEVLKEIMRRMKKHKAPMVAHVHDELVIASGNVKWKRLLKKEMTRRSTWMKGLPLGVDVWVNGRYAH